MIDNTLKQLAEAKSKLAALEKKAAKERAQKLENLHSELGYESREELIAALGSVVGSKKTKAKRGPKPKKAAAKKVAKRAKRAVITDELKAKVVEAVKAGSKGAEIAAKFGISIPSLQNIKKAAGLTKPRSKK